MPISSGRSSRDAWADASILQHAQPGGHGRARPRDVLQLRHRRRGARRVDGASGAGPHVAQWGSQRLDAGIDVEPVRRVSNAMRRVAVTTALLGVLLATGPAAAAAQSADERDCFWQGGSRSTNVAYPDLGAYYWISAFPLPPGTELIFRGRYPQVALLLLQRLRPRAAAHRRAPRRRDPARPRLVEPLPPGRAAATPPSATTRCGWCPAYRPPSASATRSTSTRPARGRTPGRSSTAPTCPTGGCCPTAASGCRRCR